MIVCHFQEGRTGYQERPKAGAEAKELDQRRIDDRKALDAAVSEGWSVPRSSAPARARSERPYRTGSQTWVRRRSPKA